MLQNVRWVSACLLAAAAVLGGPARSQAEIQVLITEVDGGGNPVGTLGTFSLAGSGSATPSFATASFTNISVTVNRSTSTASSFHTLNSTVNLNPNGALPGTHAIKVTVTDDNFQNSFPNGPATVTNNAGTSAGLAGGTNTAEVFTQLFTGTITPDTLTSASSPTGTASATIDENQNVTSSPPVPVVNVASIPSTYAVRQTIFITATANAGGAIDPNSSLGGTLGSTIRTTPVNNPVPAPAGLLLAATALPVLGFRRVFRRKAAV